MDSLSLHSRVNGVAGDALYLSHYQGTYYAIDLNFTLTVGLVEAIAGDVAILIGDILSGGGSDLEGNALQRLARFGIPLVNDETSGLGIGDNNRLGVAAFPNNHIGGGLVDNISARRRLDFSQYISAGS